MDDLKALQATSERAIIVDDLPDLERLPLGRHSLLLRVGRTADGSELTLPVNILAGRMPHPRLLMVAGVHGDEYEGILAQLELWREIKATELAGTIVIVPVANPPAFGAARRRNPADEVDMNRVFPGDPHGTVTERLAHRLFQSVLPGSDLLLSMHSWTADGAVVPYVEYPKNSPVTRASHDAAVAFGLDYVEALDWLPGLLVAAANRAGVPAIEPEIGGGAIALPERRALYRRGTLNLLRHMRMLPGEPQHYTPREVVREAIVAPIGGLLLRHIEPGDHVTPGQPLATICDLNGHSLAEITAPDSGLIAAARLRAAVQPGDMVALLFRERCPED